MDDASAAAGRQAVLPGGLLQGEVLLRFDISRLGDRWFMCGCSLFLQANWYKAEQYCRFHGMHLASINSAEEQRDLQEHIQAYGEKSVT